MTNREKLEFIERYVTKERQVHRILLEVPTTKRDEATMILRVCGWKITKIGHPPSKDTILHLPNTDMFYLQAEKELG